MVKKRSNQRGLLALQPPRFTRNLEFATLALILLVALGLRLYRLDSIPPGLTHDEAAHGHDAAWVMSGYRPIYFTVGYGREPAFDYFNAVLFSLAGREVWVLRASAVLWGMAAIVAAYLWARLALGVPAALGTVALMAVSFWPLAVSRQALRSGMLPALFALAVWVWWRYYYLPQDRPRRPISFSSLVSLSSLKLAIFPLLIAVTLYTYLPARGLWIIFPLFLVYLALFHRRPASTQSLTPTLLALAAAFLLALPLFNYLRTHPGAEQRLAMLDAPLQALGRGDNGPALANVRDALLMLVVPGRGDHFLAYTLPGKPIFDPLTFALFVGGVALAVRRWRQPAWAFALLWLIVGLGPSLLTGPEAATTRSLGALPVIYLFPALALCDIAEELTAKARKRQEQGLAVRGYGLRITHYVLLFTPILYLALLAIATFDDYFTRWAESPDVRAAYQSTLMSELATLAARPEGGAVVLSSVYPGAAHDPYIAEMVLQRPDLRLRWIDGREAFYFPSAASSRLIVPAGAPLDLVFQAWAGQPAERVELRPDDLDPYFDVYDWQPVEAVRQALTQVGPSAVQSPTGDNLLLLPVSFGGAVELAAYQWLPPGAAPGDTAVLLTLWRVADPVAVGLRVPPAFRTEAALFVHVLDAEGQIVSQQDRLDAPSWDWEAGDYFAQLFRLPLPADLPPGEYAVEVGLFNRADSARLPAQTLAGEPLGDHVTIAPLAVVEP